MLRALGLILIFMSSASPGASQGLAQGKQVESGTTLIAKRAWPYVLASKSLPEDLNTSTLLYVKTGDADRQVISRGGALGNARLNTRVTRFLESRYPHKYAIMEADELPVEKKWLLERGIRYRLLLSVWVYQTPQGTSYDVGVVLKSIADGQLYYWDGHQPLVRTLPHFNKDVKRYFGK